MVDCTSLINSTETDTVVVETPVIDVLTVDCETILVEHTTVEILTTGSQGPPGPTGAAGTSNNNTMELLAGQDLEVGDPVYVSGDRFYIANNTVNFKAVGIVSVAALDGEMCTVVTSGQVSMTGITSGARYFLGGGVISETPPSVGYVVPMGIGVTSVLFNVDIGISVLLVVV